MTYAPQAWHDLPSTDTPLSAARLSYMEAGIAAAALSVGAPSNVVENVALYAYGNSYLYPTGNAQVIYFDRLKRRLNPATALNFGNSGMLAADACSHAYGTFTALHEAGTAAGTWTPAAFVGGVVVLDLVRNDAGLDGTTTSGGTTAKSRAGFTNALDALIRLIRASVKTEDTAAGWTYTGTWTADAGNNTLSNNTAHHTSTPGDKATITMTGTDFDLIILGFDASGAGLTGAAYTVKVDGVTFTTGTANDQTRKTGHTPPNTGYSQLAVPLRGLTSASHTIEVSHTGTAGTYLYVDALLTAGTTPPTVIIPKCPQLTTAGYSAAYPGVGAGWTTDQVYNSLIDTVVARFPNDQSVVAWDPNANGWNPSTMIGNTDGFQVHLNDVGNGFYADGLMGVLNTLTARNGLVRL